MILIAQVIFKLFHFIDELIDVFQNLLFAEKKTKLFGISISNHQRRKQLRRCSLLCNEGLQNEKCHEVAKYRQVERRTLPIQNIYLNVKKENV